MMPHGCRMNFQYQKLHLEVRLARRKSLHTMQTDVSETKANTPQTPATQHMQLLLVGPSSNTALSTCNRGRHHDVCSTAADSNCTTTSLSQRHQLTSYKQHVGLERIGKEANRLKPPSPPQNHDHRKPSGRKVMPEHMPTPKHQHPMSRHSPPTALINTDNKFGQLGRREQHTFAAGNALAVHTSQQCRTFQGRSIMLFLFAVQRVTARHK